MQRTSPLTKLKRGSLDDGDGSESDEEDLPFSPQIGHIQLLGKLLKGKEDAVDFGARLGTINVCLSRIREPYLMWLLPYCVNLVELDLNYTRDAMSDALVELLADSCPLLVSFNIAWTKKITDVSLQKVAKRCTNLEVLDVSNTGIGDDAIVSFVEHSAKLTHLNASHSHITVKSFIALGNSNLPLKELRVVHVRAKAIEIEDLLNGKGSLPQCLEVLDAGGLESGQPFSTISAIADRCPHLRTLRLSHWNSTALPNIVDPLIAELVAKCPNLIKFPPYSLAKYRKARG